MTIRKENFFTQERIGGMEMKKMYTDAEDAKKSLEDMRLDNQDREERLLKMGMIYVLVTFPEVSEKAKSGDKESLKFLLKEYASYLKGHFNPAILKQRLEDYLSKKVPTVEFMSDIVYNKWLPKMTAEDQRNFKNMREENLGSLHHSLGLSIRNEFDLWAYPYEPEIDERGVDCSPYHPDQLSMEVIKTVWRMCQEST